MFSSAMRAICVLLWILCGLLGYNAWLAGDWRGLIGQLAMMLLSVVIWLGAPTGASEFRAPTAGTRSARLALYAVVLVMALASASPWPMWFDDGKGSEYVTVLVFAFVVIFPFLQAERGNETSRDTRE